MLGDSLRRRNRPPAKPDRKEQKKPRPRITRGRSRLTWPRWLLLAVGILVVSFGVGYLLATQVIFPAPETAGTGIPVPDLYGLGAGEAQERIEAAGLELAETGELTSMDAPAGTVLAQDPLPEQQLRRGAGVSLTLSSGPPVLHVPAVIGLSGETARDLLEGAGFVVETEPVESRLAEGIVARTMPEPGSPAQLPATVTLGVSIGPPPPETLDTLSDTVRVGALWP